MPESVFRTGPGGTKQRRDYGIAGFLGALSGKGWTDVEPDPGPTASETQLGEVESAGGAVSTAQETDIAGANETNRTNKARADALGDEQNLGQADVLAKFDDADAGAESGLAEIQDKIEATRAGVDTLPADVKGAFDEGREKLDAGLEAARSGMGSQRNEALSNVMEGRSGAMDAAVSSIHGATAQQISNIDAMVQQGQMSPSQATAMKAKIKMGSSMQLSAAVGQTAHMFTQTQAQVATSFGQMFTSFETTAAQVGGAFEAQAAGAFGQANQAKAQFNVALTGLDAQATSQRDTILSTNAAARGAIQNANDVHNMNMLDYQQDTYVNISPAAMNNLTIARDLMHDMVAREEFIATMEMMQAAAETGEKAGFWGTLFDAFEVVR